MVVVVVVVGGRGGGGAAAAVGVGVVGIVGIVGIGIGTGIVGIEGVGVGRGGETVAAVEVEGVTMVICTSLWVSLPRQRPRLDSSLKGTCSFWQLRKDT